MGNPVIRASFRVDNQLLNEAEKFRQWEEFPLSKTQYVVYLIGLGRKMLYNSSANGRAFRWRELEYEFLKKYPKITTQGTKRIQYNTESVWLNALSTAEINKYIFFALKKLEVENGLSENTDD